MLNKYGKVSGGTIFDMLDKYAHKIAIEYIGECVTSNAEIKFLGEMEELMEYEYDILFVGSKSITLSLHSEKYFVTFTFVKRKDS